MQTNEDGDNEGNETFTLTLSNATNATLDTDASATGTIFDGVTSDREPEPVPALPLLGQLLLALGLLRLGAMRRGQLSRRGGAGA